MAQPDDPDTPPAADRTVFMPSGSPSPALPSHDPVTSPPPAFPDLPSPSPDQDHAATVFAPGLPNAPGPEPVSAPLTAPQGWDGPTLPPALTQPPRLPEPPFAAPAAERGRVGPGVVLNHIYEVHRFIARGGMGEVFEGVNVNTDERVAIKVILPHLAADPSVQAMFRKEARTLTRLSHPGLVQYRVLAQEPGLGVLYIVTDYIDGGQLSDYIGQIHPGAEELEQLLRRLAAGLAAAHDLGAIHRDISPDNVLLPEGRLNQAKIIDFGIAKDLDGASKTIVGDGFAGKLGFVAPEQFGDFDRQVGPWTDVYSLALVLLTVAAGRPVDMGATLVDAIDKRRKGPDLSPVPATLRPVFEGMLKPNPQERFRSMGEVLAALDTATGGPRPSVAIDPPPTKSKAPLIAAAVGGVVVLALVGVGVATLSRRPAVVAAASPDAHNVRAAVDAALPGVACTWLDVDDVSQGANGVSLRLSGVAGSPAGVQPAVLKAAAASGAKIDQIDTSNVFPVASASCASLDTLRGFRAPADRGRLITSPQSNWELANSNPPCTGPNAKVTVDLKTAAAGQDFTLLGVDRRGGLQQIFANRAGLQSFRSQFPELVGDKGGGTYSTVACQNETGLVGEALVAGKGPFDVDLPSVLTSNQSKIVDDAWLKAFADKARAGGWKVSMVWYRVVNDEPG